MVVVVAGVVLTKPVVKPMILIQALLKRCGYSIKMSGLAHATMSATVE